MHVWSARAAVGGAGTSADQNAHGNTRVAAAGGRRGGGNEHGRRGAQAEAARRMGAVQT